MGNCFSRRSLILSSRDYLDAEHNFTETQLQQLHAKLCEGSPNPSRQLKRDSVFDRLLGEGRVDQELQERLVHAITHGRDSQHLQFMEYLIARAKLETGSVDDVESFCYAVLQTPGAGVQEAVDTKTEPTLEDVRQVITSCLKFFIRGDRDMTSQDYAAVDALVASVPTTNGVVHPNDLTMFLDAVPAVKQLLRRLPCGIEALPMWCTDDARLVLQQDAGHHRTPLLHDGVAWLLAFELLDPALLQQWQLAYSTDTHEASLAAFMTVVGNLGPSLLVVEAANGAIFGAFAADAWTSHGQYYGAAGSSTFVFSLSPQVAVYHSTGESENYQWCCEDSETHPNGLGLGGREQSQAIFIDDTFRRGHSVPTSTYGNACLGVSATFEIARVECWLVNPDTITGAATVRLTDVLLVQHDQDFASLDSPVFDDVLQHRTTFAMSV